MTHTTNNYLSTEQITEVKKYLSNSITKELNSFTSKETLKTTFAIENAARNACTTLKMLVNSNLISTETFSDLVSDIFMMSHELADSLYNKEKVNEVRDVKELIDNITEAVSSIQYYQHTWDDGESSDHDFEDDGFLHIIVGKYRFVFYNGQEKGMLKERQIPAFRKRVLKAMEKVKQ